MQIATAAGVAASNLTLPDQIEEVVEDKLICLSRM